MVCFYLRPTGQGNFTSRLTVRIGYAEDAKTYAAPTPRQHQRLRHTVKLQVYKIWSLWQNLVGVTNELCQNLVGVVNELWQRLVGGYK